jgi:hypothetical protein
VLTAISGREGLELLAANWVDGVVVDCQLQPMCGYIV